jgi:hypothetical protein
VADLVAHPPHGRIPSQSPFDYWLAHMEGALDDFLERVPPGLRAVLDLSVPSLDLLEAWLLDRYEDEAAIRTEAELPCLDGAARYVGEVFRQRLGGRWRLRAPGAAAGNLLPELTFNDTNDPPMSPFALVTAALARRTGECFSRVFQGTAQVVDPGRRPAGRPQENSTVAFMPDAQCPGSWQPMTTAASSENV